MLPYEDRTFLPLARFAASFRQRLPDRAGNLQYGIYTGIWR